MGALITAGLVNDPCTDAVPLTAIFECYDVHEPHMTPGMAVELGVWAALLRTVFETGPAAQASRPTSSSSLRSAFPPRQPRHPPGAPPRRRTGPSPLTSRAQTPERADVRRSTPTRSRRP